PDEAVVIEAQTLVQPLRRRNGARHHEEVADLFDRLGSRLAVAAAHSLQVFVALDGGDLAARTHFDRRILFDAADEIARHAVGELALAHHHDHAFSFAGEVDGGLPRGIASAGDHDFLAFAQLRLHRRGEVVDAGTVEAGQILDRQPAIFRPGGDDDRP